MEKVLLLSGAYDNGGAFKPAGDFLDVGDEPGQITSGRASDMVTAGYAEVPDDGAAKSGKGGKAAPEVA
jgi:hypothetical protein